MRKLEKLIVILLIVLICFNTIFSQYAYAFDYEYNSYVYDDWTEDEMVIVNNILNTFYEKLKSAIALYLTENNILEEFKHRFSTLHGYQFSR